VLQEKIVSMEDSSDTIGNRNRIPFVFLKVRMPVMTIDIVLDELFTVFWKHAVNFRLICNKSIRLNVPASGCE
jgi:hypothetical protein